MNSEAIKQFVDKTWDESIIPTLEDYIKIPCVSPAYEKNWQENMEKAAVLAHDWCQVHAPEGAKIDLLKYDGLTPMLFIDVPGEGDDTVLLYGHFDKQPEMTGWDEDLGPWKPVIKDGKLYGRGGADDGYSVFAALTAINAVQKQQQNHPRCVVLIEFSEEGGSHDLPAYLETLQERIGTPKLVIGLDSGAGNYEQLWVTSSLRGNATCNLKVEILTEGVHSGIASGIVPSSFRIIRQLMSRIEDETTGEILLEEARADIPQSRIEQADIASKILGSDVSDSMPWVNGASPQNSDMAALLLKRTWHAALSIVGVGGIPDMARAGNVLRPYTEFKLSVRTPPTCDAETLIKKIKEVLEYEPPYGARVTVTPDVAASGWHAPETAPWLETLLQQASQTYFGRPAQYFGEGGTIPFMGMLGEWFPEAQFLITGVLGPKSNAHGPNEFLHLGMAKKLTCCISNILSGMIKGG